MGEPPLENWGDVPLPEKLEERPPSSFTLLLSYLRDDMETVKI